MSYDNTNKGVLFKNDDKVNEKQPDYSGKIDIEGKTYWLSAWVREAKSSGKKFFSLSVTDPENRQRNNSVPFTSEPQKQPDVVVEDIGDEPINLDDIPF